MGNPGTGKTSVAEACAELLQELGIAKNDKFIKVNRPREQLVAGFVGGTSIKTQAKINEAKGGVILIDEAYMLTQTEGSGGGHRWGGEAVNTLMTNMLDRDPIFIFTGYKDDMKRFIRTNDGMISRITHM